jgi:N-acetylmuramoyl-L-alanine amidase
MLKYLLLFILLLFSAAGYSQNNNEQQTGLGVRTVVIDPGHGGSDPGAAGANVFEKKINLAVALKLGKLIEEWFPDVKVLYTRTEDVTVALVDRSKFANNNSADLFISIHANAPSDNIKGEARKTVSGYETWIMGLHKTEENLQVAMFENSSMKNEENYESDYNGFDPTSPESYIMFSLIQNEYLEQSLKMAEFIQDEFQNGPVQKDRGIKQAGFYVLWATASPSVLIELGFVSNLSDEAIMMDADKQQEIAECILRAFKRYKEEMDKQALGIE